MRLSSTFSPLPLVVLFLSLLSLPCLLLAQPPACLTVTPAVITPSIQCSANSPSSITVSNQTYLLEPNTSYTLFYIESYNVIGHPGSGLQASLVVGCSANGGLTGSCGNISTVLGGPGLSPTGEGNVNGVFTTANTGSPIHLTLTVSCTGLAAPGDNIGFTANMFTLFFTNSSLNFLPMCPAAASARGDPQFVGLRGQSFQVHGLDSAVYALISQPTLQLNAKFAFLQSGRCPSDTTIQCWSHPGSYLASIGVVYRGQDGRVHKLAIHSGSVTMGFSAVTLDDVQVKVGGQVMSTEDGQVTMQWTGSHHLVLTLPDFVIDIDSSDLFVNLAAVRPRVALSAIQAHGLLGQTTRSITYPTALRYVEGDADDYVIADDDLFGHRFLYTRFTQ
jgi:hypothetical protein